MVILEDGSSDPVERRECVDLRACFVHYVTIYELLLWGISSNESETDQARSLGDKGGIGEDDVIVALTHFSCPHEAEAVHSQLQLPIALLSEDMTEMMPWSSLAESVKREGAQTTATEFSNSTGSFPTTPVAISTVALNNLVGGPTSNSQERVLTDQVKINLCDMEDVEEDKHNLDPGFPRFVKSMHPSNVGGEFRLRLPAHFCNTHLPKQNTMITLIDENRETHTVSYIASKNGFGGGWKAFSIAQKLVVGDALIFQLVKPTEFQVSLNRIGGASYSQKRVLSSLEKARTIERAEEVRANLDPGFPSFVKSMIPAHVSGEFWMRLPTLFCHSHLPKQNVKIKLIDKNREECSVNFLVGKTRLGGGWRDFSIAHKLVEGDALVFHLVKPTEFQVYITKAYNMTEIDGVLGHSNLGAHREEIKSCKRAKTHENTLENCRETFPLATLQQLEGGKSRSDSEDGSEVTESLRTSESSFELNHIKDLKNFTVVVNGLIIDPELPDETLTKYYELCWSRNAFLHDNLIKGTNRKLSAGVISQTIDIVDAMKACTLSTPRDEFVAWDKSLEAFEHLGMNVGFLRSRLHKLMTVVFESEEEAVDSQRYREFVIGKVDVKEEMRTVRTKLTELEEVSKCFDSEIETLKVKAKLHELKLQAVLDAPW